VKKFIGAIIGLTSTDKKELIKALDKLCALSEEFNARPSHTSLMVFQDFIFSVALATNFENEEDFDQFNKIIESYLAKQTCVSGFDRIDLFKS